MPARIRSAIRFLTPSPLFPVYLQALNEESTPMTAKDWDRIRAAGRCRFHAR
jgi:hypothetical protein